jgi:PRTRC genetic system protein C
MGEHGSTRIFYYDGNKLDDPMPDKSIDEVRQFYANVYGELYNATYTEKKDGADTVITFEKRVGTKGGETVADGEKQIANIQASFTRLINQIRSSCIETETKERFVEDLNEMASELHHMVVTLK